MVTIFEILYVVVWIWVRAPSNRTCDEKDSKSSRYILTFLFLKIWNYILRKIWPLILAGKARTWRIYHGFILINIMILFDKYYEHIVYICSCLHTSSSVEQSKAFKIKTGNKTNCENTCSL